MKFAVCGPVSFGLVLVFPAPVHAGWRVPPGLGVVVAGSKAVGVYDVESVNAERRVITFKKVEDVRGKPSERFRLYVTRETEVDHRAAPGQEASEWLLGWARPGRRGVSVDHPPLFVGGHLPHTLSCAQGGNPLLQLSE